MKKSVIQPNTIVDAVSELDALLSSDEVFQQDFNLARKQLEHFLFEAVSHHIRNNKYYAHYCDRLNFSLSMLKNDLGKVPLLPSAIFKRHTKYVQTTQDENMLITTSSGTQGTISKIPRDNTTLMRFFASVSAGVQEVLGIEQSELHLYSLSPY